MWSYYWILCFIPRLRKCQLSTNNIHNPEKRAVLNCMRPKRYTDRTWYEPRGQSDSVGRVWPGQPQGVVLVKLVQVNLTDDHSAVSSVADTDKQALIYCGSAAVLCRNSFTFWLAVVDTEDIWGFMWMCCFTRCSHKIKLSPCTSPPSEANTAFFTATTRADHWPLYSDQIVPTYSIVLIFILILSFNLGLIALQVKSCVHGLRIKVFLPCFSHFFYFFMGS